MMQTQTKGSNKEAQHDVVVQTKGPHTETIIMTPLLPLLQSWIQKINTMKFCLLEILHEFMTFISFKRDCKSTMASNKAFHSNMLSSSNLVGGKEKKDHVLFKVIPVIGIIVLVVLEPFWFFTPAHCYIMFNNRQPSRADQKLHRSTTSSSTRIHFKQVNSCTKGICNTRIGKAMVLNKNTFCQRRLFNNIKQSLCHTSVDNNVLLPHLMMTKDTSERLGLTTYPYQRRRQSSTSIGNAISLGWSSSKTSRWSRRSSGSSSSTARHQTEIDSTTSQQQPQDIKGEGSSATGDESVSEGRISTSNNVAASSLSADDSTEWNAITDAFHMYKAAYGNLKIPARFVVPAMPPWPKEAWNMRLGQKVAAIRLTGKHVQDHPERRKELETMGFVWRLRAPSPKLSDSKLDEDLLSFDQIYSALQTYKDIHGDLNIPNSFVVPDVDPWKDHTRGMPLGRKLSAIRSKEFLNNNPSKEKKLLKLGLPLDNKTAVNDVRYQKVYKALAKYKEINGDLLVPQPFVIPEGDGNWPEEMWGLRLGARVNAIRSQGTFVNAVPERKDELDELGFVWDYPVNERGKKRGRKKKEPIQFTNIDGSTVPFPLDGSLSNSLSPEQQQQRQSSMSLGGDGNNIPSSPYGFGPSTTGSTTTTGQQEGQQQPWNGREQAWLDQQQQMQFGQQQQQQQTNNPIMMMLGQQQQHESNDLLQQQSHINKHILDPNTVEERSLAIGLESGIFSGVDPVSKIAKVNLRRVNHPWIFDDYGDGYDFNNVVEALTIWGKHYNGTFNNIDEDYVITEQQQQSSQSSLSLSSLSSTYDVDDYRGTTSSDDEMNDESINVEDEDNDDDEEEEEDADGDSIMKDDMQTLPTFPSHLVGMMLGSIVKRIREGDVEVKIDPEKKIQLDNIGFDWGDSNKFLNVPFEKAMCACLAYYQIRGDLFVYPDFTMPGDDPWPRILEGYPIGEVIIQIRDQQLWLEEHYPEKKSMLDMLEFVWFPRYESKLSTFEMEHMERFGTPQPSSETLERMFPRPEEYWDNNNPPIFNFTLAEELIEEQIDILESGSIAANEDWDDEIRSEEDEEEEKENDQDAGDNTTEEDDDVQLEWENDDEELDDFALQEFDEAVMLEEEDNDVTPLKEIQPK